MTEPEPREEVSRLIRDGHDSDAIDLADKLLLELVDPYQIVGVQLSKLGALLNVNRVRECPAVIDAAWAGLQHATAAPFLLAEFHALAADVAYRSGSLPQCVSHLVRGARALDTMPADRRTMRAWTWLAVTYSYVGFHEQAAAAQRRAEAIGRMSSAEDLVIASKPEIWVRQAAALDQQGETERAKAVLVGLVGQLGPDDVPAKQHPYLGYGIARLACLGGGYDVDAYALLRTDLEPFLEHAELRQLGEAALAIAENRPQAALALLDGAQSTYSRLGPAEVPRLRALAYTALGDDAAAHAADRLAAGIVARTSSLLYDLFVQGISIRLDYEELQRTVRQHADAAHTDVLTGLPNRRHLERFAGELAERGVRGVLGVGDLDGFKAVNTVHGHLSGDQVLRQVAGILARSVRAGDFLARYGGDEFIFILPGATPAEARDVADRLVAAVAEHDWESLVPGTPVTMTIGLAELGGEIGLNAAFRAADLLMLQRKRSQARDDR